MKKVIWFVLFLPLLSYSEELVLIKAISNTSRSFVIPLGSKHGISLGQESLFTTKNLSVAATAKEVTRHHSFWELNDKMARIPFHKGQYINYTNDIKSIYNEIPLIKSGAKMVEYLAKTFWIFRISYTSSLTQTTSNVSGSQESSRTSTQIQGLYSKRVSDKVSWAAGLRYDWETNQLNSPTTEIPSNRIYLLGQGLYHFNDVGVSKNHFYSGLTIGLGRSSTNSGGVVSSGFSLLLPELIFGFNLNAFHKLAFLLELALENIVSLESYSDGLDQNTDLLNFKFSLGLKF
ncbi:MAG: hypothetical protein DRQ88_00175 [Epsilonproteobacteria bacterium]|nr:MAG: hypothetical protein DRQ89_06100 [Campylobacterota bacterium]RLA68052.1 MAG: hypothetical protein DRQ88_00175 [Campylobacterota bacterium]